MRLSLYKSRRLTRLLLLQSILSYNGAAIIAMAGKDCVGIAWCVGRGALLYYTV